MKKYIGIALAVLMVLGLSGMVAAQHGEGEFEPAIGERGDCHGTGTGALVKVSDPFDYSCNGKFVVCSGPMTAVNVFFKFHASVAQWLKLNVSGTRIDWKVIKPGRYSTPRPIIFKYQSNGNLMLKFRNFGNLKNTEGDVIGTSFQLTPFGAGWVPVEKLNVMTVKVPEDQSHEEHKFTLDQQIFVEDCASACEYQAKGIIQVILTEQKDWMAHMLGKYST